MQLLSNGRKSERTTYQSMVNHSTSSSLVQAQGFSLRTHVLHILDLLKVVFHPR